MVVAQLQKTLIIKRTELKHRLTDIERDIHKGRSQDLTEQSIECENDQVLAEIHQKTLAELQKIEQTLALLQTEQHGICNECGLSIEEQRLATIPTATTCSHCAKLNK